MRIREPVAADVPLIVQTYVRESRRSLLPAERVSVWRYAAEAWIAAALEDGRVRVAADPDPSSDVVLGYVVGEPGRLDWVWVKGLYRRCGVARRLVREVSPVRVVTHTTARWQREMARWRGWQSAPRLPMMELAARGLGHGIKEDERGGECDDGPGWTASAGNPPREPAAYRRRHRAAGATGDGG